MAVPPTINNSTDQHRGGVFFRFTVRRRYLRVAIYYLGLMYLPTYLPRYDFVTKIERALSDYPCRQMHEGRPNEVLDTRKEEPMNGRFCPSRHFV